MQYKEFRNAKNIREKWLYQEGRFRGVDWVEESGVTISTMEYRDEYKKLKNTGKKRTPLQKVASSKLKASASMLKYS